MKHKNNQEIPKHFIKQEAQLSPREPCNALSVEILSAAAQIT